MNVFKWLTNWGGTTGDHSGWQNNSPMVPIVEGTNAYSTDMALQIPTVWACIDLLSHTIASLPCDVFIVDGKGNKNADTKCNLNYILSESPNADMTPYEFFSAMVVNYCLHGNAYALISRWTGDKKGQVKGIYPLSSEQMQIYRDPSNGQLIYRYLDKNDHYQDYKSSDVLHWKCMGNGITGLKKLDFMKISLAESNFAQRTAVSVFNKKGKMSGILTTPKILTDKQKGEIADQFQKMRNDDKIPVLPADMSFQQLSLNPAEQQLLDTRKFSVEEICRWFGVPSALVNSSGGAPGSNIEQVTANFYKSTILPMIISLEQAIMKRVPCVEERYNHAVKFRLSFLNRANDEARSRIAATAVQNGWKTRNEVRVEEGLPPVKDGDTLTAQSNLFPLEQLGQADASQVSQTPITENPTKQ